MRGTRRTLMGGIAALLLMGSTIGMTLSPAPAFAADSGDGQDRHVLIQNNTEQSVMEVYASNVDVTSWQEDMLGSKVIGPGESTRFNIDDGTGHCYYDLKAVMQHKQVVIRRRINVCKVNLWTISD